MKLLKYDSELGDADNDDVREKIIFLITTVRIFLDES